MQSIFGNVRYLVGTLAVTAILMAGFVGCDKGNGTGGGGAGNVKLGFLVKQPDEPWFQNEWKFADQAAQKYGFKLIKIGARDGEQVLTGIDNLAAQGAQGFVICTPDVKLGPAIVAKANSHNLKVFSVDDRFVGSDGRPMTEVPYMGISAFEIGKMVGKSLHEEMTRRGWKVEETAAMGVTLQELETAKQRTDGAAAALVEAGFPKEKIHIGTIRGLADVPNSIDAANIVLTQHADVKNWLIFGMNDESVLGGVRATEGRNIPAERVIGIGIGGSTGMTDFQKDKPTGFVAAVLISPKRHGFETSEHLYKWVANGTEPPKETFTTGILINRDNYRTIMKEQGLLD